MKGTPTRSNDQNPQTQVLYWQDLFFCSCQSPTRLRTGMEHCGSSSEREARVSYCNTPSSTAVLNQMLGNIGLMHRQWMRHDSSNCKNLAMYSVTNTEVFRSGSVRWLGYSNYIGERLGEQGCRIGESARLPPMWPWFYSGALSLLLGLTPLRGFFSGF